MVSLSLVFLIPLYIGIIFSLLRKRFPNMFIQLGTGIVLSLLGVTSLLITDVLGYAFSYSNITTHAACAFQMSLSHNSIIP